MMTRSQKAIRTEFCKDICDKMMMEDDPMPVYPVWVIKLALHMTRRGWTKPSAEVTIDAPHGSPKAEIIACQKHIAAKNRA